MYVAVVASGIVMIFAQWQNDALTTDQFALAMLSAMVIGLGAFVFGCTAIKCPKCGERWLWRAVRTRSSGSWLHWLQSQDRCPACGAYGRDAA
jgi:predicted RNA-binding Zn-ribbon protein involved in translation (DUF1610 family)